MTSKRYTEEFKIEAVKQVTELSYSAHDVAERLGTTTNSLYNWIRKYGPDTNDYQKASQESDEIWRLKKKLKRATVERDLLKKAAVDSASQIGEVCLYRIASRGVSDRQNVRLAASKRQDYYNRLVWEPSF